MLPLPETTRKIFSKVRTSRYICIWLGVRHIIVCGKFVIQKFNCSLQRLPLDKFNGLIEVGMINESKKDLKNRNLCFNAMANSLTFFLCFFRYI